MGERTKIAWSDATTNFWIGCTEVSQGCANCYARTWAARFGQGWGKGAPRRRVEGVFELCLRLERRARKERVWAFVNSLSDFFDDEVPEKWRADALRMMHLCPHVVFMLLTKRPQNIVDMLSGQDLPGNMALGTTVENQDVLLDRIVHLRGAALAIDPAFTFLSMEPLLGAVDLAPLLRGIDSKPAWKPSWCIIGGESGTGARPCRIEWVRSIVQQCLEAGVTPFVKQLGKVVYWNGLGPPPPSHVYLEDRHGHWKLDCLKDGKHGADPADWPEDLAAARGFPQLREVAA